MEGEREEQGETTESGTAPEQVLTQDCSGDGNEIQNLEESTEGSEACDSAQETPTPTNTEDNANQPQPTQEEVTPPTASSHTSNTQNRPSEPCWYCLRSLNSQYRPETSKQEDSAPSTQPPSSGQKMSYQTDPRPHFGVAWSSRSTCRPLWDSEGPCWGHRNQEVPNQVHTCPHCNLALASDTLRWHEAKCLLFEGLRNNSNK